MKKNKKAKYRPASNKQVIMPNALVQGFEHGLPPVTELERTKEDFDEFLKQKLSSLEEDFQKFQQDLVSLTDKLAENISTHDKDISASYQEISERLSKLDQELSLLEKGK